METEVVVPKDQKAQQGKNFKKKSNQKQNQKAKAHPGKTCIGKKINKSRMRTKAVGRAHLGPERRGTGATHEQRRQPKRGSLKTHCKSASQEAASEALQAIS